MTDRNLLGSYLKVRRAQVQPSTHGLPQGGRRRVAGLRREEVADLAGISIHYYIRLEQGRERHPSHAVLDALARVLQLDEEGRSHLGRLTEPTARFFGERSPADEARSGLVELVDLWPDQVVLLLSRYRDVVAANDLARRVNPHFMAGENLLREVFLDDGAKITYPDWGTVAREGVAALRAAVGAFGADPIGDLLVEELREASPEFAELWRSQVAREKPAGTQRFHVRGAGTLTLRYEPLAVPYSGGQLFYVFFAPPGSPDADLLTRLGSDRGVATPAT